MEEEIKVEDEMVEQYFKDGAVVLRQVFTPRWVEAVRRGIARVMENPSQYSEYLKKGSGAYFSDYCNWQWVEEFRDYVYNSLARTLVAKFMRSSSVSFYHEHVLNKEPGTTKMTPWHQDQPYYPIDGDKVCSLWMPVDPVPYETSLQFVAGSHLWQRWYVPRKFATENNYPLKESQEESEGRQYFDVPVAEIDSGKWPILQWECQPGDVIVFHMRTLHGAPGNASTTTHRRILSTRWLGEDAVVASRPWEVSPPITGGLLPGQPAVCDTFPLVYSAKK